MDEKQEHRMARLEQGQNAIRDEVKEQSALLRTALERADEILRLLTPIPTEGPKLEELLAQMVTMLGDQNAYLKRLDERSEHQERELPLEVVQALVDRLGLQRGARA